MNDYMWRGPSVTAAYLRAMRAAAVERPEHAACRQRTSAEHAGVKAAEARRAA